MASRQLVEELLSTRPDPTRPDLRLLSATDGRGGLEVAFAERPDVILMDSNMPTLSGLDGGAGRGAEGGATLTRGQQPRLRASSRKQVSMSSAPGDSWWPRRVTMP